MSKSVGSIENTLAQCLRVAAFGVFASAFPVAFRLMSETRLEEIEQRMDKAFARVLRNAAEPRKGRGASRKS